MDSDSSLTRTSKTRRTLLLVVAVIPALLGTSATAAAQDVAWTVEDPKNDSVPWADIISGSASAAETKVTFQIGIERFEQEPPSGAGTAFLVLFDVNGETHYAGFMSTLLEEFHTGLWHSDGYPVTTATAEGGIVYGAPATMTVKIDAPRVAELGNLSLVSLDFKGSLSELVAKTPARQIGFLKLDEAITDAGLDLTSAASLPNPETSAGADAAAESPGPGIVGSLLLLSTITLVRRGRRKGSFRP